MAKRATLPPVAWANLTLALIFASALMAFGLVNMIDNHPPTWIDALTYPVIAGIFVTIGLAFRFRRTR